ncbi:MAG: non-homologous end-joining DNA ligase, partial [Actinomycetota bacterium]
MRSGSNYHVFDIVYLDGHDLSDLPLRTRKSLLKDALKFDDPLRFVAHRNETGEAYFEEVCSRPGWEGIIAKRADSPYRGTRSRDWLKFKCANEQEFVISGYTDPQGSRTGLGALLVGYYDGDDLHYAGKVGTGYGRSTLDELSRMLGR